MSLSMRGKKVSFSQVWMLEAAYWLVPPHRSLEWTFFIISQVPSQLAS